MVALAKVFSSNVCFFL